MREMGPILQPTRAAVQSHCSELKIIAERDRPGGREQAKQHTSVFEENQRRISFMRLDIITPVFSLLGCFSFCNFGCSLLILACSTQFPFLPVSYFGPEGGVNHRHQGARNQVLCYFDSLEEMCNGSWVWAFTQYK